MLGLDVWVDDFLSYCWLMEKWRIGIPSLSLSYSSVHPPSNMRMDASSSSSQFSSSIVVSGEGFSSFVVISFILILSPMISIMPIPFFFFFFFFWFFFLDVFFGFI